MERVAGVNPTVRLNLAGRAYKSGATCDDLSGVDLGGAHLDRAHLDGANLHTTLIGDTTFGATDLRNAKSLETVNHPRPSTLGINTLCQSGGHIPEVFLCGCGVPDSFIDSIAYLFTAPQPSNTIPAARNLFTAGDRRGSEEVQRCHPEVSRVRVGTRVAPSVSRVLLYISRKLP